MSRPEDILPPDLYYNDTESAKYTTSSRIQAIQASMTNRALELLDLEQSSLILDIGCGSGLSGEILSEDGHIWVGMDIAPSMLDIALQREAVEGDLFLADMGQGIPFRAGAFDAAISISAIQWLCNAETSGVSPEGRLRRFFDGLYAALKRGGKAVCQFYPKNEQQRTMISSAAVRAGFGAGILEDDGGTKNVKTYPDTDRYGRHCSCRMDSPATMPNLSPGSLNPSVHRYMAAPDPELLEARNSCKLSGQTQSSSALVLPLL